VGKCSALTGVFFSILALGLYWPGSAVVICPEFELETFELNREVGAVDGLRWHDGWLYLASEGSSSVFRADVSGHVEVLNEGELSSPEDLVIDESGAAYVTDDDKGGAWAVRVGEPARRIDSEETLVSTEAIALLPSGVLAIGDGERGCVVLLSTDGRPQELWQLPAIKKPESIAVAADGTVFVADDASGVIVGRTPDGATRVVLDRGDGIQEPETLLWHDGWLYIVDNAAGRLVRYREGLPLEAIVQFGGDLKNIQGIAADDDGNLYLSVQSDLGSNEGYLLRFIRQPSIGH
jgi:sugar lactone lactonase YvrE